MHRYFLDMHKMLFWLCPDVKDINCESRKDYVFQLGPWPQSITINSRSRTERIFVDVCQHVCRWQIILANMESFDLSANPTESNVNWTADCVVVVHLIGAPFPCSISAWSRH